MFRGRVAYEAILAEQLAARERVWAGEPGTIILCEHPPVITLGRSANRANVLAPGDVPVVPIERGGDVTYHGPGQLVAYPIVLLRDGERDLHRFLRNLEEAVIRTCARFGLATDRETGKTGVWTGAGRGRKKLCSMGIACRKWVTFHGLALNVASDLTYFQRINPCGFESNIMSSVAAQLEKAIDVDAVRAALVDELGAVLGRTTAQPAASVA